jgi:hypothetical protein
VQDSQRGALELLSSRSKHTKRRRREHDAEDGNAESLHGGVVEMAKGEGEGEVLGVLDKATQECREMGPLYRALDLVRGYEHGRLLLPLRKGGRVPFGIPRFVPPWASCSWALETRPRVPRGGLPGLNIRVPACGRKWGVGSLEYAVYPAARDPRVGG